MRVVGQEDRAEPPPCRAAERHTHDQHDQRARHAAHRLGAGVAAHREQEQEARDAHAHRGRHAQECQHTHLVAVTERRRAHHGQRCDDHPAGRGRHDGRALTVQDVERARQVQDQGEAHDARCHRGGGRSQTLDGPVGDDGEDRLDRGRGRDERGHPHARDEEDGPRRRRQQPLEELVAPLGHVLGQAGERARGEREREHRVRQQVDLLRVEVRRERLLRTEVGGCVHRREHRHLLRDERPHPGERQVAGTDALSPGEAQGRAQPRPGTGDGDDQRQRQGRDPERRPPAQPRDRVRGQCRDVRLVPVRHAREHQVHHDDHDARDERREGLPEEALVRLEDPPEDHRDPVQGDLQREDAHEQRRDIDQVRVLGSHQDVSDRVGERREQRAERHEDQEGPPQQRRRDLRHVDPGASRDGARQQRHHRARERAAGRDLEQDVGQDVGRRVGRAHTGSADRPRHDERAGEAHEPARDRHGRDHEGRARERLRPRTHPGSTRGAWRGRGVLARRHVLVQAGAS